MDIESLLYQYNPWWEGAHSFGSVIQRQEVLASLYPLLNIPEIIILTGLRRVGKTTLMKSLIHYLIKEKAVSPQHCLYVSMDDYLLSGLSLLEVINAYRQVMKISVKQPVYVFFDEITYLKDFQIQLKNLYDKAVVKCIVSSSSSSILKDNAAYLTGRKRVVQINPLTFSEYLQFKEIKLQKSDKVLMESYFLDYMKVGGMPEYVLRNEREYMVNLIDDILMKDIVGFHGIRHPEIIKQFFLLLMERAGKQISLNKVAHILGISPDTARRYLTMFEETYLIHLVPRQGKTNETLLSAKKVYATDLGMRNVMVGFRDKGAIFENIVFMRIKDRRPSYVYTEGSEIDFLVDDVLIEVKYQRELEGKQRTVFDGFKANKKLLIQGYSDLAKLNDIKEER